MTGNLTRTPPPYVETLAIIYPGDVVEYAGKRYRVTKVNTKTVAATDTDGKGWRLPYVPALTRADDQSWDAPETAAAPVLLPGTVVQFKKLPPKEVAAGTAPDSKWVVVRTADRVSIHALGGSERYWRVSPAALTVVEV